MHSFALCGFLWKEGIFFLSAPTLESGKHNSSRHIPEMCLAAVAFRNLKTCRFVKGHKGLQVTAGHWEAAVTEVLRIKLWNMPRYLIHFFRPLQLFSSCRTHQYPCSITSVLIMYHKRDGNLLHSQAAFPACSNDCVKVRICIISPSDRERVPGE